MPATLVSHGDDPAKKNVKWFEAYMHTMICMARRAIKQTLIDDDGKRRYTWGSGESIEFRLDFYCR